MVCGLNVIECEHGKLKRIIGTTLKFNSMKTAYATIDVTNKKQVVIFRLMRDEI